METTEIPTPQGQSQQVNSQQQEMSEDTKTLVTVLALVVIYPVGLVMMWVWTKWEAWVKWLVTVLGCLVPIIIFIVFGSILFAIFQDPAIRAGIEAEMNASGKEVEIRGDDMSDDIERSVKSCNEGCDKYSRNPKGNGLENCRLACEALRDAEK